MATRTATRPVKKAVAKKTAPTRSAAKKTVAAAKQHPVVTIAQVPEQRYFKEYISRSFHGRSEFAIFTKAMENRFNVLIEGPTGPGKTSAALAYAAKMGIPFYAIPSNIGIEPSQLFGKYIPSTAGGFVWQDGPVTDIIRNGGFLLINEVNFMPERVATVLFGLLDKRREIVLLDHKGETVRAHWGGGKGKCWCAETVKVCDSKRVLVAADMNPDYEGTRSLNKAFRNRFAIQLVWDYDSNVEGKLVKSTSLVNMAVQMRAAVDDFETPIATNMLQEFERVYGIFGFDFAAENFVNHFTESERGAALQIMKTYEANIVDELDVPDQDQDEEVEPEVEDEWGVEGKDWVYEEDN